MNVKNQRKFYTVYQITNTVNSKIYVGYHSTDDLDDGYMGSGKLLALAYKKYGTDKFKKHYIQVFDTHEEAESLERMIVNEEFILREDTYNLCLGGNICSMPGELNPFFGKKHSAITREKIGLAHRGRINTAGNAVIFITADEEIIGRDRAKCWLLTRYGNLAVHRESLMCYCASSEYDIAFKDKRLQQEAEEYLEWKKDPVRLNYIAEARRKKFAEMSRKLWENPEYRAQRSREMSEFMQEYVKTDAFKAQILKINRNPDKIRKTAEKHRGMKRTEESKRRMSESAKMRGAPNANKIYCYNPSTLEKRLCRMDEMPYGWLKGFIPKNKPKKIRCYNPETLESRRCIKSEIPEGWAEGFVDKRTLMLYCNPVTKIAKRFIPGKQPADWIAGNGKS